MSKQLSIFILLFPCLVFCKLRTDDSVVKTIQTKNHIAKAKSDLTNHAESFLHVISKQHRNQIRDFLNLLTEHTLDGHRTYLKEVLDYLDLLTFHIFGKHNCSNFENDRCVDRIGKNKSKYIEMMLIRNPESS